MKTTSQRKKVNFMIDKNLFLDMQLYVADGERSDFVNHALEKAIRDFKMRKAFEALDAFRESTPLRITTKEIIRLKNEGRR